MCTSESQVFLPLLFLRKGVNLLQVSRKHSTFHLMCTADFHTPSLPHLIVLVIIWLKTIGWGKIALQVNSLGIFDLQECGGSNHYLDYNVSMLCVQNIQAGKSLRTEAYLQTDLWDEGCICHLCVRCSFNYYSFLCDGVLLDFIHQF